MEQYEFKTKPIPDVKLKLTQIEGNNYKAEFSHNHDFKIEIEDFEKEYQDGLKNFENNFYSGKLFYTCGNYTPPKTIWRIIGDLLITKKPIKDPISTKNGFIILAWHLFCLFLFSFLISLFWHRL